MHIPLCAAVPLTSLVTWNPTPTSVAASRARTIAIDPVKSMNSRPLTGQAVFGGVGTASTVRP